MNAEIREDFIVLTINCSNGLSKDFWLTKDEAIALEETLSQAITDMLLGETEHVDN